MTDLSWSGLGIDKGSSSMIRLTFSDGIIHFVFYAFNLIIIRKATQVKQNDTNHTWICYILAKIERNSSGNLFLRIFQ